MDEEMIILDCIAYSMIEKNDEFFAGKNISGLEVIDIDGNAENVFIPETVNGIPVISIEQFAVRNQTGIKTVSLPASLLLIDSRVFKGCSNLEEVEFRGTQISIPDNELFISHEAFQACSKLKVIKGTRFCHLGSRTFQGCAALTDIELTLTGLWYNSFENVPWYGLPFESCLQLDTLTFHDDPYLVIPRNIVTLSTNEYMRNYIRQNNIKVRCNADSPLVAWSHDGIEIVI